MRLSRLLVGTVLAGALACPAPLRAADQDKPQGRTRVRLGGIYVGAGYSRYSGYYPYGFGYPYWRYWGPYWSPFWDYYVPMYYPFHPGFYNGFARGPNMGEVKLKAQPRDASVYIDGAYAGVAADLKTIWLEPGAYNLEVKADSRQFARRIYVLSGKTLRIDAGLASEKEKTP